MRPRWPWAERWEPHELGRSLPLAGGLRRGAWLLVGLAAAGLLLLVFFLHRLGQPGATPAAPAVVQEQALDRLATAELPLWDPGAELPEIEPPAPVPPPSPPLWTGRHPADPPPRDPAGLARALRQVEGSASDSRSGSRSDSGGGSIAGTTYLDRARERQPGSWSLAYNAGVAYLRSGFVERARDALTGALTLLNARKGGHGSDPEHLAAQIATRYAAGHVDRRDRCVEAIRHLKLAVRGLRFYVDAGGAEVFDRKLPFPLRPTDLDNLDVWAALTWLYDECDGDYPDAYFQRYPEGRSFREGEYGDPELAEVQDGPFPQELAACIESDGATARCWAVSNLNRLYFANRPLLESEALPRAFETHRGALARLAYHLARTAATGPDADRAAPLLTAAHRLARGRSTSRDRDSADLTESLDTLARYLGASARNYAALAEPYRGRGVDQMPWQERTEPEAVKGMAWALRERWQGLLERRQPQTILQEVARARQTIPAEYLSSLDQWRTRMQDALRDSLAREIREQKHRGNLSMAAGLRDLRADYLGKAWPDRAKNAWWTPLQSTLWWGALGLYVLFLVGLAVTYRTVIYPYLLYTTPYYQTEMERRIAEREAHHLPVTGREIYERKRLREGQDL